MNKKSSVATGSTQKDKKLLLSGVLVLTVANILVKIAGLIYKVPLNDMLQAEMSNVNAAHSIYNILYMISTAGIPVAVSVLVSECRVRGDVLRLNRVFRVSLIFLLVVGFLGMLLMLITAGPLSDINSDGESFWCICAISPALLFICVCSVYRGYYQGFQQMTPTAVSEIIESFGKMALGLLFISLSLNHFGQSRLTAAALSVVAITIGIFCGLLYLIFIRRRYEKRGRLSMFGDAVATESITDKSPILPRLISIAVPISLSAVMLNVASLLDSFMMRPLLSQFLNNPILAKEIVADYTTGAVTLYNLPTFLIYPIACSIVPFISAARESGDSVSVRRVTNSALRVTALIALPCALGMSALSGPILDFIFGSDAEMAANAGPLLRILAISVFLVSMLSVTNALLQANHQEKKPMLSMAIGLVVKVVSDVVLTLFFGAVGAPISTVLFHLTVVFFNFYFVLRYTEARPQILTVFVRPFVAALISAGVSILIHRIFSAYIMTGRLATVVAMIGAVLVYVVTVFLLRCISEEDIRFLPKGQKIKRALSALHLLK